MTRHDEPNESSLAGAGRVAEPAPDERDVVEEAEEAAAPGSDLSPEFREALADSELADSEDADQALGGR